MATGSSRRSWTTISRFITNDWPDASARRAWLLCAALVLLMLALQGAGALGLLRYERDAVLGGQVWRLLGAHVVHLGWTHCLLNIAGLVLCMHFAAGQLSARRLAWQGLALGAGVGLGLLLLTPAVADYAGLSGVLYGLFVLVLAPRARHGDRLAALALLVLVGRLAWQSVAGADAGEEALIGGHIVTAAHWFGILTALALLAAERAAKPGKSQPNNR